jgi:hypothetical protein
MGAAFGSCRSGRGCGGDRGTGGRGGDRLAAAGDGAGGRVPADGGNGRQPHAVFISRGADHVGGYIDRAEAAKIEWLPLRRPRGHERAASASGARGPEGVARSRWRRPSSRPVVRGCGSRAWQRPGPAPVGQTAAAPLSIERLVVGGIRSYRVDAVVSNQPIDCRLGRSDPRPMRVNIGCDAPRAIGGPDERGRPA